MSGYTPAEAVERAVARWWLVAALAVWGGVIGWAVHRARPPLYEAEAVYYITLDFTDLDLTVYEEDLALWGAASIFLSDPVRKQVVEEARREGIAIDLGDLDFFSTLERKQARWILRLRHPDPLAAATIANLWSRHGEAALTEAHAHAVQAEMLRGQLSALEACVESRPEGEGTALCTQPSLAALREAATATAEALQREQLASLGVHPALRFELMQEARLPERPAQYGRNTLVLAGALIGFLLGAVVVNVELPGLTARGRQA